MKSVIALILTLISASAAAADQIIGQASVIDGNTIEIQGQRIRLFGIDAPESAQTCSDTADYPYRCRAAAANALVGVVTSRLHGVNRATSTDTGALTPRAKWATLISANGLSAPDWRSTTGNIPKGRIQPRRRSPTKTISDCGAARSLNRGSTAPACAQAAARRHARSGLRRADRGRLYSQEQRPAFP